MASRGRNIPQDSVVRTLTVTRPAYYVLAAVLGVLILLGVYAWTRQLSLGLQVTGMNTPVYWGLYIVNFVFFIGLSAGGIMVAAMVHALSLERFRSVARIAEILAISCLILASLVIIFDMGRPERVLNLFIYARFGSPLVWDILIIISYLALAFTMGYFSTRADLVRLMDKIPSRKGLYRFFALGYTDLSPKGLNRDRNILRVIAIIAIPGAVALHSVTAWILGLVKANPGWHSALLAPLFVGSAMVSGIALVAFVAVLSRRFFRIEIEKETIGTLGKLLFFLIPLLGYFLFAEFLTVMFAGETLPASVFRELMTGRYAPVFWFDLVLGLVAPFAILGLSRFRSTGWTAVASALIFLGVLAERINIVLPPQLNRGRLPYPPAFYSPTAVEIAIVVGLYALGALSFIILVKLFPMTELASKKE